MTDYSALLTEIFNRLDDPATKDVAVDTETSGLDWRHNHVVGWVLTFGPAPQDTYYLPVRHAGDKGRSNIPGGRVPMAATGWQGSLHPVEKKLARSFRRQDLRSIYHYGAFDLKFMHRHGVVPAGPLEDTMVNQYLLNEHSASFSLDACCRAMGVQEKKGEQLYRHLADKFGGEPDKKQMGNFWLLAGDDPIGVDYARGDGTSTWQLRQVQHEQLALQDLYRVHAVECRCIRALNRMMVRGTRVDEEQLERVAAWVHRQYEMAMARLPKDFNERSPLAVRKLFSDAGHTDWPMTAPSAKFPNGQPSFPEEWLMTNPTGQLVVRARKFHNLENSFLLPLKERHLWNGRVHPDYNQTRSDDFGTYTGRLSCSNPNMQQVHKRNKELGTIFRSIFVPDEGMSWGSADYSQCEPRLLAYYGRVQVLIDGYKANPPVDAHSAVALAARIDRESGKRLNQALITGAGRKKAAAMLGRPMDEADIIVNKYFEVMPEIPKLQKRAAMTLETRTYLITLLGRRARMDDRRFSYKAVNKLLQTGNADILKERMATIDEYLASEGDHVNLLQNVHDAFEFQFPEEHRATYERALAMMVEIGPGHPIDIDIPMVVEADEGANWAEATYGRETADKYLAQIDQDEKEAA